MNTLPMSAPAAPRPAAAARAAQHESTMDKAAPVVIGAVIGLTAFAGVGVLMLGATGAFAAITAVLASAQSAWYLSRASAVAAYLLVWLSMLLGLSMTNRLARVWPGGPTAGDLHEHTSLLGLGFGVLHALTLLADQYIGYSLVQILVPFAAVGYLPLWVGFGQIALYLMLLGTASSYVRSKIGVRAWRAIHMLSFALFALSLVHGLVTGTDSGSLLALLMYVVSGASVAAMTVYRIVVQRRAPARPKGAHA